MWIEDDGSPVVPAGDSSRPADERAAKPIRRVSMGSRLQRLSIAGILLLAIASALAFVAIAQLQRDAAEASTLGLARALGSAVQLELGRSVAALQALAARR